MFTKKKKLFIVTDQVFDKRQSERYQLKALNKKFDLKIVVFKNNFLKIKNCKFYFINNLISFFKFFNNKKKIIYIEILSNNLANLLIKLIFFIKRAKKILIVMGHYPTFKKNENIIISFFKKIFIYRKDSLFAILKHRIFMIVDKIYKPSLIISGGEEAKKIYTNRTKKHFNFTSHDFYLFDKNNKNNKNNNKKNKYILFLDSGLLGNSDFTLFSVNLPFDKKEYVQKLKNFFSILEKKYNLKTIISPHPKTNLRELKKNFKKFKVIPGQTEKLIANSQFVVMHKSTAVSYVVLNQKPLILITFDKIKDIWYGKDITNLKKLLGVKELNLDRFKEEKNICFTFNKIKYKNYIHNFIKSENVLYEKYANGICKAISNL